MYTATPKGDNKKSDKAILYISDILGLPLLQNKLYVAFLPHSYLQLPHHVSR